MRRLRILVLVCWVSVMAAAAQNSLRLRLDSLLQDRMFETSQVGLMVYDLTSDSLLYAFNPRQMMRPASTLKLVTAITALDRLGADYMFSTRVCHAGSVVNGRMTGTLYCVGGFDPALTDDDMKSLAARVYELGVDTLGCRIVTDLSMKDSQDYGEGWCWDDDNPRLTPLSVGRKDIFVERLLQELEAMGVVLEVAAVETGRCPAEARVVCLLSHHIGQVLNRMMKKSDNFYAEAMFYQIAASSGRRMCKASDAAAVIGQFLSRIGLGDQPYRIADGSGLSPYNYLSVEQETLLLRYAWLHPEIYTLLIESLPVAGVDGTLEKRMRGTAAHGHVRAKTGTLTGVSSLAGYCTAANGHTLAFSIINQGIRRNQSGKTFQDKVCRALCEKSEERKVKSEE